HDAGCQVTLAAMNTSKHYTEVNALPEKFRRLADLHTSFVDNKVRPLGAFLNLFSKQSYHISRFITPGFKQLLGDLLEAKKFDLVIFDNLFTAPYVDFVRSRTSAKLLLRQHNVEYKIWTSLAENTGNPVKKRYIKLLASRLEAFEKHQLNAFDGIIALTKQDKADFEQMGCTKPIHVSPVGIELNNTVSKSKPLPKSVFHLGAMDWQPNQQAMQWFVDQVWPKVAQKDAGATFYMAGKKMPQEFYNHQSKTIKIVGEVDDAVSFMQTHRIMVVPLFAGSGIRVKILEGMALGKPVITTSLGIRGIEHEPGKNVLVADTADEFCQCIELLLNNPLLCDALGAEARKLVEKEYSNKGVTGRLLQFCKEEIL
ncbi:MAG: glycosyltransferase, partial [Bacteroidota bacterium]